MKKEIQACIDFVTSHLYGKLPRRRVEVFAEELHKLIAQKFHQHWFPIQPFKDAAHRCLRIAGPHADPVVFRAAQNSGMDVGELFADLPPVLTLWVDPGHVAYRLGDKGPVVDLYSGDPTRETLDDLDMGLRELGGFGSTPASPTASLPSSPTFAGSAAELQRMFSMPTTAHSWLPPSPSPPMASPEARWAGTSPHSPSFTAASFAQTKFGSTKPRIQAKRPKCLQPSFKQLQLQQQAGSPRPILKSQSPIYSPVSSPSGQTPWNFQPQHNSSSPSLIAAQPSYDLSFSVWNSKPTESPIGGADFGAASHHQQPLLMAN